MRMWGTQTTSWLCRDETQRERVLDMEQRLKPVRAAAFGLMALALVAVGPWIGWWPLGMLAVTVVAFLLVDRALDGVRRPELWIGAVWAGSQVTIATAIALTGGPLSPAVSWLAIPVVTLSARFDRRGVFAGVAFTALLVVVVTVVRDPQVVATAPQFVVFPLALLAGIAILSTALMASDIHHRSESVIDGLTGMLNRRALDARLRELSAQAELTGEPIGVVIGDLDHFKRINDDHGHAAGDAVLVDTAYALRKELRAFDLAYRMGGEEFLIVLPGATLAESAGLAERLRSAVSLEPRYGQLVTMSFGVACSSGGRFDPAEVIAAADGALYNAKAGGRNRVAVAGMLRPVAVPVAV
jgi:diguanylate cyclase (GGDEF)-like protein